MDTQKIESAYFITYCLSRLGRIEKHRHLEMV